MLSYEEAHKKSLEIRWKLDTCNSGEECWCRLIIPETPIIYDFGGRPTEFYIVGDAALDKETAEYLINLHNKSLDDK